ncbi:thioredoxin family protein [Streptomyces sp. NPDC094438]|uniref:thioredoxin family protein n=1 Tax=Streptomyces sp. NPDC094438 TaxID=3366061 RepID=UPI00380CBEB6
MTENNTGTLIATDESIYRVIQDNEFVLMVFESAECGPCQGLEPLLREISSHLSGFVAVATLEVNKNLRASRTYDADVTPTSKLFHSGEEVGSIRGYDTRRYYLRKLKEFLSGSPDSAAAARSAAIISEFIDK